MKQTYGFAYRQVENFPRCFARKSRRKTIRFLTANWLEKIKFPLADFLSFHLPNNGKVIKTNKAEIESLCRASPNEIAMTPGRKTDLATKTWKWWHQEMFFRLRINGLNLFVCPPLVSHHTESSRKRRGSSFCSIETMSTKSGLSNFSIKSRRRASSDEVKGNLFRALWIDFCLKGFLSILIGFHSFIFFFVLSI